MSGTAATRKVQLLDLKALHAPIRDEILAEVTRVIDAQSFIMGPDIKELEKEIAAYCQVQYAYGCANGSDALLLALLAAGIGHGDRALTTPFTFFATAGAIVRAGAVPVFADIDPVTFNICPDQVADVVRKCPGIKAMIPVHLFGGAANMDPLMKVAAERGLKVIEDGAQAIGAEYKGKRLMSIGDIGTISFFPSKNLGGFGDGGAVTTNDEGLAQRLSALRVHGSKKKYYHEWVGVNSRLDTLQAAILRVKLRHLDKETFGRQKNAEIWRTLLAGSGVTLPVVPDYTTRHVYNQFVIRSPKRDALKQHLADNGVGTEIYYPLSMHEQQCFANLGYRKGDFPESERAAAESLAIPVHSALPKEDMEYVAGLIRAFSA
ncbi:MAG: DegT/DnrJ/EryC1/StrS family aminotransferase [Acidobacteria bacterium]|nr:DegT/DnrJ/EryC1/StrS family aminotransferase [Acidobacteriota bacterium]